MSGDRPPADLEAEREIDLRSWLDALRSRWWIAVAGFVVGRDRRRRLLAERRHDLRRDRAHRARPGVQPERQLAVLTLPDEPGGDQQARDLGAGARVRGREVGRAAREAPRHVSTSAVNQQTGANRSSRTQRNAVLVAIQVQLDKKTKAEDAAQRDREVRQERDDVELRDAVDRDLRDADRELHAAAEDAARRASNALNAGAQRSRDLSRSTRARASRASSTRPQATLRPDDRLADDAPATAVLAQQVEQTQIIQNAKAEKSTARSRRNSVVVGALIGLLIGAIVAIVVGLRAAAPSTA